MPQTLESFVLPECDTYSVLPLSGLLEAELCVVDRVGVAKRSRLLRRGTPQHAWKPSKPFSALSAPPDGTPVLYHRTGDIADDGDMEDEEAAVWHQVVQLAYVARVRLFHEVDLELLHGRAFRWHICPSWVSDWSICLPLLRSPEDVLAIHPVLPIKRCYASHEASAYYAALLSLLDTESAWFTVEAAPVSLRMPCLHVDAARDYIELTLPVAVAFAQDFDWIDVRLFHSSTVGGARCLAGQGLARLEDFQQIRGTGMLSGRARWVQFPGVSSGSFRATLRLHMLPPTARHWYSCCDVGEQQEDFALAAPMALGGSTASTMPAAPADADFDGVVNAALAQLNTGRGDSHSASVWAPNAEQREAVGRALYQPMVLVHGPAGTGKTNTAVLIALVCPGYGQKRK